MLTRVLPAGVGIDPHSPGARRELLAWYASDLPECVRLNLVSSLDGRASGPDGTSESLTTRTDRTILGVIREASDAVLVGAETVRAEHLGRPRRTPLVILSASGDLTGHGLTDTHTRDGHPRADVLVVTTPTGRPVVARTLSGTPHDVIVLDEIDGQLPLDAVIAALRTRGFRRIVAEGGPHLAASLLEAGLVDELCLTVVPRILGEGIPVVSIAQEQQLAPILLLVDSAGVQYARWALSPAT